MYLIDANAFSIKLQRSSNVQPEPLQPMKHAYKSNSIFDKAKPVPGKLIAIAALYYCTISVVSSLSGQLLPVLDDMPPPCMYSCCLIAVNQARVVIAISVAAMSCLLAVTKGVAGSHPRPTDFGWLCDRQQPRHSVSLLVDVVLEP